MQSVCSLKSARVWMSLSALSACAAFSKEEPVRRPNIVLMVLDDIDNDELGFLGDTSLMTPHIDQLAGEGIYFNRGYVTSSICMPSRYSILTGNYASRSGLMQTTPNSSWRHRFYPPGTQANVHFNTPLAPDQKTVANYLQSAGYRTGLFGKWHLGRGPEGIKEKQLELPGGIDPDSAEAQRIMRDFHQHLCTYVTDHFGFDEVDAFYENNPKGFPRAGYPKEYGYHNPEWITAKARSFIERTREAPFFLYYALTLPHGEEDILADCLRHADPLLTPAGRLSELPNSGMPSRESVLERIHKAGLPETSVGMLWVDDAVGAVLKTLDDCGLTKNTLVIFISDNGNHAKEALYDGGCRTPFFARWPGVIPANTVSDQLVSNIDIAPTLLDIVGISNAVSLDGKSILSIMKGRDEPVRDALLLEVGHARAVVTKDMKYIALRFPPAMWPEIESLGGLTNVNWNAHSASPDFRIQGRKHYPNHYYDPDQYFDFKRDPNEQHSLVQNPEYKAQMEQAKKIMRRELDKLPHTFSDIKPE